MTRTRHGVMAVLVVALVASLLVVVHAGGAAAGSPQVRGPVIDGDWPDPEIVRDAASGRYFAFATNFNIFGIWFNVPVRSSTDLENWQTFEGDALPTLPGWAAVGRTWSPGVARIGGAWNMYFTARHRASGDQCIGVARAGSVTGPYSPAANPLVCQTDVGGSIDASPFRDPATGAWWLHWKSDENSPGGGENPRLWARRLSANGMGLTGGATAILADQRSVSTKLIENPDMIHDGGRYWLTFSLDGYATAGYKAHVVPCSGPAGPCTWDNPNGPVWLDISSGATGPGGTSFFRDGGGRALVAFHAWRGAVGYPAGRRATFVEPISFDGAGRSPRIRPDMIRPPERFAAANFVSSAYRTFLSRDPSASEQRSWVDALTATTPRGALVERLATSDEWLGGEIENLYRKTLGRGSDPTGKAYWRQMVIDGVPLSSVGAHFYASDEFYARSGSTPAGFVEALYREILHRSPEPSGFRYWVGVAAGGTDRFVVADSFYRSVESRRDRVHRLYRALLGRTPDAGGWAYWAEQLHRVDDVRLAAFLASSDEFYRRAQA